MPDIVLGTTLFFNSFNNAWVRDYYSHFIHGEDKTQSISFAKIHSTSKLFSWRLNSGLLGSIDDVLIISANLAALHYLHF